MSTLKTNALRGLAAAGIAAGLVAASSSTAQAQVVVANAYIGIPQEVVVGDNPLSLEISPTGDTEVLNSVVTITPDDPAALDFNPAGDDRCVDGDNGSIICSVPGVLPTEGVLLSLSVTVLEGVDEESDLGFGLVYEADDVESATMHTGLVLGGTQLDPDNPAPEPTEPPTEEPTEEPSDDASEGASEAPTDGTAPSDEAEEKLPTTGGNTGIMIGAAAAVAVAGAGAILFARRRKAAASWE